jgi:hypothetical protein
VISAIVTDIADAESLAATLASLTPAAVDGLVRELIVVGQGPQAALDVADDAGARLAANIEAAAASARQPWLLVLVAGSRLQMNWEAAARGHIKRRPDGAGWFQLNFARDGTVARLAESWANLNARWLGRPRPEQGLLIPARRWTPGRAVLGARPIEARILVGGAAFGD